MKNIGVFSALFLLMILLQSCNTFKVRETVAALEDSITNYNVALRWGMYKDAYSYHFSPDGKQPPAELDGLEEISVTGIKVTEKIISTDHTEANVESTITYFLKTQGTIKEIKLNQKWWFNKQYKQWFVDHPFPDFK
tara:strand:+ start:757 stop:1167 length:411 start_codon:yes stop_codon:yes gene_type:complete